MTRTHLVLLVGFAVSAVPGAVASRAGQTINGTIEGRVTDTAGVVVGGATVTMVNKGTGGTVASVTNAAGRYRASTLRPGTYELRVERPGVPRVFRSPFVLAAGQTLDIPLTLGCTATDFFSAVRTVNAQDTPHSTFCGNGVKQVPGENPGGVCAPSTPGCCTTGTVDPSGSHLPVVEKVEARGWISTMEAPDNGRDPPDPSAHKGYHDDGKVRGINEEYNFLLRLDLNWEASPCLPSGVTPINSLTMLARAVTPYGDVPDFFATPNGWAYGSKGDDPLSRGPLLKVEINGWLDGGRVHGPAPPGWITATGSHPRVLWPFDPERPPGESQFTQVLTEGDYVRLVGTLWEDGNHGQSGGPGCWNTGSTAGRGWPEIHPVDYLARITRTPSATSSTYAYLALCDDASVQGLQIPAPGPPPVAGARLLHEYSPVGAFTTDSHVYPALNVSRSGNGLSVTVGVRNWQDGVLGLASHKGRFLGFFRAYWGPPAPPPTAAHRACVAVCRQRYDQCVQDIGKEPGGPTRARCGQRQHECETRCPR